MFLVIENLFLGRLNLKSKFLHLFRMILWVLFYKAITLNQTDLCKVAFHNSSIFTSYKKTKSTKKDEDENIVSMTWKNLNGTKKLPLSVSDSFVAKILRKKKKRTSQPAKTTVQEIRLKTRRHWPTSSYANQTLH